MAFVERWVGDQLHEILGISDRTIAEYFVGLAKKSGSPQDLVENIRRTGTVDIDGNMINFAKELWGKVKINPALFEIHNYLLYFEIAFYILHIIIYCTDISH